MCSITDSLNKTRCPVCGESSFSFEKGTPCGDPNRIDCSVCPLSLIDGKRTLDELLKMLNNLTYTQPRG